MGRGGSTTRTGTATVLFTDLTGSTEARSRIGEEAADELARRHERILATEISTHHGVVVKTLGDGVMATFGSAANAMAAAIAIQQTVADVNDDLEAPLRVRIGISAGDVAWRGNDCTGTPVIEAARLCNVAGPGEIVIADIVQAMARGRGGHAFVPLGELSLKGLADPVPASRVRWPGDEEAEVATAPVPPVPAAPTAKTSAAPEPSGASGSNRRGMILAVAGGLVALAVLALVAFAIVGGDDDSDASSEDAVSAFCETAADVNFSGAEPTAEDLAALDDLEAAAPDDEIRQDLATIREAAVANPPDPDLQARAAASIISVGTYLTENCPAE